MQAVRGGGSCQRRNLGCSRLRDRLTALRAPEPSATTLRVGPPARPRMDQATTSDRRYGPVESTSPSRSYGDDPSEWIR